MFQVHYHGLHPFFKGTNIASIAHHMKIPQDYFYLISNGKLKLTGDDGEVLDLMIRAHGGKGGFGALLKGKDIKSKKKEELPEDYYDMSRDLKTGKRMVEIRLKKEKEQTTQKLKEEKEKRQLEQIELNSLKAIDKDSKIQITEQKTNDLKQMINQIMSDGGLKRTKVENVQSHKRIKDEDQIDCDDLNPF